MNITYNNIRWLKFCFRFPLEKVTLNCRHARLYRVTLNGSKQIGFEYRDPTLLVCPDDIKQRNLDYFCGAYMQAIQATSFENGRWYFRRCCFWRQIQICAYEIFGSFSFSPHFRRKKCKNIKDYIWLYRLRFLQINLFLCFVVSTWNFASNCQPFFYVYPFCVYAIWLNPVEFRVKESFHYYNGNNFEFY